MRRLFALLAILPSLTGCAGFPAYLPYTPPTYFAYRCEDGTGFELRFPEDGRAILSWPGVRMVLPQQRTASGAAYSDGLDTLVWLKGNRARFERRNIVLTGCVGQQVDTPWRSAAVRGIAFRVVGQEPGWLLEIDRQGHAVLVLDYGDAVLSGSAPLPEKSPVEITFKIGGAVLAWDDDGCRDPMSGEYSRLSVSLTRYGETLHGCGRLLPDIDPR